MVNANRETNIGYGRMSDEICNAFTKMGVDVVDYDPEDKTSHLMFMSPPQRPENWYKGQHVSIVTMWESTELAFDHFATLPLLDTIFVPSHQNYCMFSEVNPNTHRISLGCDYEMWKYTPRHKSEPFTVITAGHGARRKGFDASIAVFKRFREEIKELGFPPPRLIITSQVTLKTPDPDIIVLDEKLSAEDEAALYASAHVYLGLSRGEGWGMIPHQTIAQGMPTILTDAHGHSEFSDMGIRVGWSLMPAENEIVGRTGCWWDPNQDSALRCLLDVFNNYDDHLARAKRNAERIKRFTWEKTASQILSRLPDLPDFIDSDEQVIAPKAYLTLRVNRPLDCNIGPGIYHFRVGETYQVSPDVKRVVYDAGYCDDSCIDEFERAIYAPRPHVSQGAFV